MKDVTYTPFFALFFKIFHFLLNILGALLICCSFSKPEFSSKADPLPKSSCSLQLIPNPVQWGETMCEVQMWHLLMQELLPWNQRSHISPAGEHYRQGGFNCISNLALFLRFESCRTYILHINRFTTNNISDPNDEDLLSAGWHWLSINTDPEKFGLVISSLLFQKCISISTLLFFLFYISQMTLFFPKCCCRLCRRTEKVHDCTFLFIRKGTDMPLVGKVWALSSTNVLLYLGQSMHMPLAWPLEAPQIQSATKSAVLLWLLVGNALLPAWNEPCWQTECCWMKQFAQPTLGDFGCALALEGSRAWNWATQHCSAKGIWEYPETWEDRFMPGITGCANHLKTLQSYC